MADTKISALTAATTPLAGTEVLPIVQSSTTKKVSVANLTIGRAVELGKNSFTRSDGGTTSDTTNGFRITPSTATATDSFYRLETGSGVLIGAYGNVGDELSIWTRDTSDAVRIAQNGTVTLKNNVVPAAAKGVNFTANTPAAGMTSQLLNWYEEGTWTPTITGASGSITTYSAQVATYTRVGNMCFVQAYIAISNIGTISGALTLNGLPFTSNTTSNAYQEGHGRANGLNSLTAPANGLIGYQVGNNATIATIQIGTATGVSAMDAAALKNGCDFIVSIAYRVA